MGDEADRLMEQDVGDYYASQGEESFDYMMTNPDKTVLKNLSTMGEHLKKLKTKMLELEAAHQQAKKEYEYYASTVLPMEMFNAGVTKLELIDGGVMKYERKFYCQPNKNAQDKLLMARWLEEHGGGHLIKQKAEVADIEAVKAAGIPYVEIDDINTNSLKAFLKDKIGAGGGTVQLQVIDIPACIHFQEVGIVDIV